MYQYLCLIYTHMYIIIYNINFLYLYQYISYKINLIYDMILICYIISYMRKLYEYKVLILYVLQSNVRWFRLTETF